MMRNFSLVLVAGLVALAGCSSTPAKVDTGTIHARTFSFLSRTGKPAPGFADKREAIHPMIQAAIAKDLTAAGLAKAEGRGDIEVGYLVIVGNNASTELVDDYFGYSADTVALHQKAHKAYTSYDSRGYFEAGTLVIDLLDAKSSKLLKRGYATGPTLRNLPDDARLAKIQEVVDKILKDLRVAP